MWFTLSIGNKYAKEKRTRLFAFFLVLLFLAIAMGHHHSQCTELTHRVLKPHTDRLEREMTKCQDLYDKKDVMGGEGCFQRLGQFHIANIEDSAADNVLADNYCPSLKEFDEESYLYSSL